jgi:hypothetical protein
VKTNKTVRSLRQQPSRRKQATAACRRLSGDEIAELAAAIAALLKGFAATAATLPTELQDWNSVDQLEPISGISKWTWRRWCQTGKVASAKVGSRLLISRAEYERIMIEATRPRKE